MRLLKQPNAVNNLVSISYELSLYLAAELPGEEFNARYKKDKDHFRRLIRAGFSLEKMLMAYFRDQAAKAILRVNWAEYGVRQVAASEVILGQDLFPDDFFDPEKVALSVILEKVLGDTLEAGGQAAEAELKIPIAWTRESTPAQKALRNYTLKLAGDLSDTTRDRIKQSLLTSLKLGESQAQAAARLTSAVADPKRAAMIAHTEAVRSYTQGRLAVGREVGARWKVWDDGQPRACEICLDLNGQKVGIDETFDSMIGPLEGIPAHPWCRCFLRLEM